MGGKHYSQLAGAPALEGGAAGAAEGGGAGGRGRVAVFLSRIVAMSFCEPRS